MGLPAIAAVGTVTGGTVVFQAVYRDVMSWAMHNDTFQTLWDMIATVMTVALNILIYTVNLLVEVHNGFCPMLAVFVDVIYELAMRLTLMWFAAPVLQHMAFWLLRLVTCMVEPMLDLLMTICESFMFLVVELVSLIPDEAKAAAAAGASDLGDVTKSVGDQIWQQRASAMGMSLPQFDTYCLEHPEDEMCQGVDRSDDTSDASRRLFSVGNELKSMSDILLEVCCIIFTVMARLCQAFLIGFLPLAYSFLRMVLPKLIKFAPVIFEMVAAVFSIFTSDAVRRIVDYVVQALPIIYEFTGGILCSLVIYLGAGLCYIVYTVAVTFSFILRYVVRPLACGTLAVFAGCLESMVMAAIDDKSCYTCGNYNTACGCRKHTYPEGGCGGNCIDELTPGFVMPHTPDTSIPIKPVARNSNYGSVSSFMDEKVSSPATYSDYGAEDTRIMDSGAVTGDDKFPLNSLPTQQLPAASSAFSDDSINATPPPLPAVERLRKVVSTNEHVVVVASPGMYAELGLVQVTTPEGEVMTPVLGSLPREFDNQTICSSGISTVCTASDVWKVMRSTIESEGPMGVLRSTDRATWKPITWKFVGLGADTVADNVVDPWIRFDFKEPQHLVEFHAKWGSNDVSLLAPTSVRYDFFGTNVIVPVRTMVKQYYCSSGQYSRTDILNLQDDITITSMKMTLLAPCPGASTGENFGPLYSLHTIRALAVPAIESVVFPRYAPIASATLHPDTSNIQVWDSCRNPNIESLINGRRGFDTGPIVFSQVESTAPSTLAMDFKLTDPGQLAKIILHLRGPSLLPHQALTVCPRNYTDHNSTAGDCVTAYALTEFGSSESVDFVNARADLLKNTIETLRLNSTGPIGFYTPAYYDSTLGETGRDASYTFEFPSPIQADGFALYVSNQSVDPFRNTRATTWATVPLELGLDPERMQTAQWTLYPKESTICTETSNGSPSSDNRFAPEGAGFGSTSVARKWFAVEEVSAFVYKLGDTSPNGRRILSVEDDSLMEAHRALNGRTMSSDRVRTRIPLSDIISPLSNRPGGFRVSSASETGKHQPFHDDLSQMPDPAIEPQFRCLRYNDRMRCVSSTHLAITSPNASSTTPSTTNSTSNDVGGVRMGEDLDVLQTKLESLQSLQAQHEILRDVMLARKYAPRAPGQSPASTSSRKLQIFGAVASAASAVGGGIAGAAGAVGDFFNEMDIKGWVTDRIDDAISGLTDLICEAMQCGSYCTQTRGCDDRNDIGDCFKAFGQFMLEQIFGCSAGEDIGKCISRPFRDLLKMLLRKILWVIDQMGSYIGKLTGLGDMMKNIACIGCSITGIASGILADFADDFPIAMCSAIVDKGSAQCNDWGLGADDFGSNVFGNMFPMMKILFGLVQVLPAYGETVAEVAILIFSEAIDMFPQLVGDMFDILMWLIASSETISTVEILFEAFDPIISGDKGGLQSQMQSAASQPADEHPDIEQEQQTPAGPSGIQCNRAGEAASNGRCGDMYRATNNSALRTHVMTKSTEPVTSDSSLSFPLDASCGCQVKSPSCKDGPGTGDCKFKEGTFMLRQRQRRNRLEAIYNRSALSNVSNTSEPDCSQWPVCASVQGRVVGRNSGDDSGEFVDMCVASKHCRIQSVAPAGNEKADRIPFRCFSKQANEQGESVFWGKEDDCPSRLRVSEIINEESVHRRRASSIDSRMARRLMGVQGIFEDETEPTGGHEETKAQFAKATEGFQHMIRTGNKSYASYQVNAIRSDLGKLNGFYTYIQGNLSEFANELSGSQRVQQTLDYTKRFVGNGRRLLFGFSGAKAEKIGCGWLAVKDYSPNTYPCCRGLWCCIPPPFDENFKPEKSWFEWQDDWKHDSTCPYIETYPQGWMFALRSICKLVRDASNGVVGVWPYTAIIDTIWSAFLFPDDEWPDTNKGMWTCVGLNIGVYVVLMMIIVGLAFVWQPLGSFYYAHFAILESIRPRKRDHVVHFNGNGVEEPDHAKRSNSKSGRVRFRV